MARGRRSRSRTARRAELDVLDEDFLRAYERILARLVFVRRFPPELLVDFPDHERIVRILDLVEAGFTFPRRRRR